MIRTNLIVHVHNFVITTYQSSLGSVFFDLDRLRSEEEFRSASFYIKFQVALIASSDFIFRNGPCCFSRYREYKVNLFLLNI